VGQGERGCCWPVAGCPAGAWEDQGPRERWSAVLVQLGSQLGRGSAYRAFSGVLCVLTEDRLLPFRRARYDANAEGGELEHYVCVRTFVCGVPGVLRKQRQYRGCWGGL
jgi:hypothetical protein